MRELPRRGRATALTALSAAAVLIAMTTGLTGCETGQHASGPAGRRAPSHSPAGPVWNPRPSSVAALGDSITRGFDACSLLSDCPDVSWSTGTRHSVDSVAERLRAGHSWNFAVSGARVADLRGQAERAAAKRPGLVTVLIGANDACARTVTGMTAPDAFRTRFTAAMEALHHASPRTQVYVSSIPDLLRLWSVGRTNPLGKAIWQLGICPSMLADAGGTTMADVARRNAVDARVIAYNGILREVCARYPLCRYDGGAVFRQAFSTAELSSWDFFHPGTAGQARLALLAYEGVTATRPPG